MAAITGLTTTELEARLAARLNNCYGSSTAVTDYLDALNDAMKTIYQIGTFSFMMAETTITLAAVSGSNVGEYSAPLPADIDLGKMVKAYYRNVPFVYVPFHKLILELGEYLGMEGQAIFTYDDSNFYFTSGTAGESVTVIYQKLPTSLTHSGGLESDLPPVWSMLPVDVAEYQEKEYLRIADADRARQRAIEKIKLFARTYAIDIEEENLNDLLIGGGK